MTARNGISYTVRRTWCIAMCGVLFSAPFASAAIRVDVSASPSPARPGETLDVEFTVTNDGPGSVTDVSLILDYPSGLNSINPFPFGGSCPNSCDAGEQATFAIPSLNAGEGRTFSLPSQVAAGTIDGSIIVFDVEVFDDLISQATGTASIAVLSGRGLELALVENVDPVPSDGVLVYTLTYGLLDTASGVSNGVLSMTVPSGTNFISATDGGTLNANVIEWALGPIGPGQSGEVQVTVQVNGLGEGSIIEAEAVLEDVMAPTNRVRYQAATRVQNNIPLEIVVVASPDPVRPGETMDVEITVTNTGVFDRTGVVLTLEYPDGLNSLSPFPFGGSCPNSCNAGELATFTIGTLAGGEGRTFSLPPQVAGGTIDGFVITFEAEVSADNGDRMESGTSFSVSSGRGLELALVENVDPVPSDGVLVYTLTYGLLDTASGVSNGVLSMAVPEGTCFVSASDGGTFMNGVVEWPLGAIGAGDGGERLLTVRTGDEAGRILLAEAHFQEQSDDSTRVRSETTTRVMNMLPLHLGIVASPNPATNGETLDVVMSVTNTSVFNRTGVVLTLEYPDGLNSLNPFPFGGSCPNNCNAGELATFTIGTLVSGEQVFFPLPPVIAAGTLDGELIRFDAFVTDVLGFQAADSDVVHVGTQFDPATGDGVIDFTEMPILTQCIDSTVGPGCEVVDFNNDSVVNLRDFALYQNAFGSPCVLIGP